MLLDRKDETAQAIAIADPEAWRFDISAEVVDLCRALADPRTIPFLLRQLDDEPDDEVFLALAAIGKSAVDPLLAVHPKAKPEAQEEIVFALAALGIDDPRIEALIRASGEESAVNLYSDRGTVDPFDIYENLEEEGVPLIDALSIPERFELLESADEDYRILAAASLFHEELNDRQERTLFERAQSDPAVYVRAHCWQALDNATGKAPIAEEMIARLKDSSREPIERAGLLVGLAALTERQEVRAAVEELYAKPETRLKALEAMWRSLNPDFAEHFPEHLDDKDTEIRRVALRGIGAQGLTGELGKVRALLKDDDLREDALFAYALAAPGKDSPAFLRSLLKKIETEAGGFSEEEEEIVRTALDERLRAQGKPPVFYVKPSRPLIFDVSKDDLAQ